MSDIAAGGTMRGLHSHASLTVSALQVLQRLRSMSSKLDRPGTAGVTTPEKQYTADVVVLAAALGIPKLAQQLGLNVPLTAKPRTVTVITQPLKPILKHIVVTGA